VHTGDSRLETISSVMKLIIEESDVDRVAAPVDGG
jgi:hypothetical protein